ncbi:MAG: helix-turn-helix transcriptional regulator [Clostridia bacterium]|nr:helix-turn-helix transcriptional regulator [Clostridia bacterium]
MARIIDTERKNIIGSTLKRLRESKNLSQKDLSVKLELLGVYVCRGSISRIEDYSRTVTDIELYALATALGVGIQDLLEV